MNDRTGEARREKIGLRFITALDDGNLDALAALWAEAATDVELGRLFCELTESVYEEEIAIPNRSERRPRHVSGRAECVAAPFNAPEPPTSPSVPGTRGMLVLSRKTDQQIVIGDNISVTVIKITGNQVRLGISAPADIPVHRQEIHEAIGRDPTLLGKDLSISEE